MKRNFTLIALFSVGLIVGISAGCGFKNNPSNQAKEGELINSEKTEDLTPITNFFTEEDLKQARAKLYSEKKIQYVKETSWSPRKRKEETLVKTFVKSEKFVKNVETLDISRTNYIENGLVMVKTNFENDEQKSVFWMSCYEKDFNEVEHRCTKAVEATETSYHDGRKYVYRVCATVDAKQLKCTSYNGGDETVIDAVGHVIKHRFCKKFDDTGNCIAYHLGTDETYDSDNNLTMRRSCCLNEKGECADYKSEVRFTYNAHGSILTARTKTIGKFSSSSCYKEPFSQGGLVLDTLVNPPDLMPIIPQKGINIYNAVVSDENYDKEKIVFPGNYDVSYDKQGVHGRMCEAVDDMGNCTKYGAESHYADYVPGEDFVCGMWKGVLLFKNKEGKLWIAGEDGKVWIDDVSDEDLSEE